jgi:hypothetical protein
VSGGDSSTTFNGARLRRGIVNPQAPVGCSGDVKQSPSQITVSDNQNSQSLLGVAVMLLATGERYAGAQVTYIPTHQFNSGKVSVA